MQDILDLMADEALKSAPSSVMLGMIGWTGPNPDLDPNDLGDDSNDGYTLTRVQLFAGRNETRPLVDGRAQGFRLLCTVADHVQMFGPPRDGDRCIVLVPAGLESTPGAAVVVAIISKAPTTQYSSTRGKIDVGPDRDLVIKGRSIALSDYDNRFISIGPDNGIVVQEKDGSGVIVKDGAVAIFAASGGDVKSALTLKGDEASIYQKSSEGNTCVVLGGGKAQLVGTHCAVQGSAVYLGASPSMLTAAALGPSPIGVVIPTGGGTVPVSASVFISP